MFYFCLRSARLVSLPLISRDNYKCQRIPNSFALSRTRGKKEINDVHKIGVYALNTGTLLRAYGKLYFYTLSLHCRAEPCQGKKSEAVASGTVHRIWFRVICFLGADKKRFHWIFLRLRRSLNLLLIAYAVLSFAYVQAYEWASWACVCVLPFLTIYCFVTVNHLECNRLSYVICYRAQIGSLYTRCDHTSGHRQ